MVHFLIKRPIAVIIVFVAGLMLGIVSYRVLPVSLMPAVDIPEITVQVSYQNSSARELDNAVVKNLRSQLVQVAHLSDIKSETRDGQATLRLLFIYGTKINYAFIEVNEKIDAVMDYLPRNTDWPQVIKASASNLPEFYLNLSLKTDSLQGKRLRNDKFIELNDFCENVISRRIEQLPQVAMVDLSGLYKAEVFIKPNKYKMESLGLTFDHIKNAINESNITPGNLQLVKSISIQVVDYFFDLLVARSKVVMAGANHSNVDTLYNIGQKRQEITSLSLADVLTLKVEALNSHNNLAEYKKILKTAQITLYSYLRLNDKTVIELNIPDKMPNFQVNYEEALQQAQQNIPDQMNYQLQLLKSASNLERTQRQSLWSASVIASYGLNQQSSFFSQAYQNPLDQQRATIGLSIPILDWGQRKGNINMAKKNFEVTRLTMEQATVDFKQQIMVAITNLNMQYDIVNSTNGTREVAKQAYEITKQRFLIGKTDVNSLRFALTRQEQANLDYLSALRAY